MNSEWELWAIFADRLVHDPDKLYQTINRDDSDLRKAAEVLGIELV